MKTLTLALVILLLAGSAKAKAPKTLAEAMAAHNKGNCIAVGAPETCNDAALQATGKANGRKNYTSTTLFQNEIVVPKVLQALSDEEMRLSTNELTRKFNEATDAQRIAACLALNAGPDCK